MFGWSYKENVKKKLWLKLGGDFVVGTMTNKQHSLMKAWQLCLVIPTSTQTHVIKMHLLNLKHSFCIVVNTMEWRVVGWGIMNCFVQDQMQIFHSIVCATVKTLMIIWWTHWFFVWRISPLFEKSFLKWIFWCKSPVFWGKSLRKKRKTLLKLCLQLPTT